ARLLATSLGAHGRTLTSRRRTGPAPAGPLWRPPAARILVADPAVEAMTLSVPLFDTQGRVVRDLRISVTDRCNLRCVYCMPAEGMPWLSRADLLSYEEITRFARVCLS